MMLVVEATFFVIAAKVAEKRRIRRVPVAHSGESESKRTKVILQEASKERTGVFL